MARDDVTFDAWGTRCAAWLYRPDAEGVTAADPRGLPCIVMAHGFAGVREARLDAFAARFSQAGFAVLLFDYRGFGASEGEPRQVISIPAQLADWAAAIAFARTLEGIDPERIAAWGTSFSGGHVVTTAARDHRLAAAVAQAPFADGLVQATSLPPAQALRLTAAALRDELGALRGAPPRMIPAVGPPGSLAVMTTPDAEPGYRSIVPPGAPWRNEVAARIGLRVLGYRPVSKASDVRCPLLVVVCDDDAVTPPPAAVKLAQAAPRGELLRYAGAGHFDVYTGDAFERAAIDQIAFFTEHLLVAPAPRPEPALV